MTHEQAIDLLDNLIGFIEDSHGSDYDEALKLAIKALEQEPCEYAIARTIVNGEELGYLVADDILSDLPSVTPQKWIPVSERLPEHSGNYLVTIADSNYENGQVFKISWFYPSDHRWSFKNANVLAWMPLPEPYKAESEE